MSPLFTEECQRSLVSQHPVITRRFSIATLSIQQAVNVALNAIAIGKPGIILEAPPRFGKTRLAEYLSQKIATEAYSRSATILFNALQLNSSRHMGPFYRELMFQSNTGPIQSNRLSEQLRRAWWARATEHGESQLIFICDEGQKLSEAEFRCLIDIFNYMHRERVSVTSIFICQSDIISRRETLLTTGATDIVFRFMPQVYAFRGIASLLELETMLSAYDDPDQLQFPADSGVCFTRFFVPRAYSQGWRLAAQASRIWQAFHPNERKPEPLGVGMEWVAGAIQHLLALSIDEDEPRFDVSDSTLIEAIQRTGFFDAYEAGGMYGYPRA